MIDKDIPEFTSEPDRDNQSQAVFSGHIGTRMKEEKILIPILNIWTEQVNSTATDVNNDKLAAAESAASADSARLAAEAAVTAEPYDPVGPYGWPMSAVGSNGLTFRCVGTDVVGDDPVSSVTGNWIAITTFAPSTVSKVFDYNLTATDLTGNVTFTNRGAPGEIVFIWPGLAANQKARFWIIEDQYLQIKMPAGKQIRFFGGATAIGGYIRAKESGKMVELECDGVDVIVADCNGTWNYDQ